MKNEKGLAKFIDVCAKGLGKVYEPIHLVRMAKAEAKSMQILAEAARNTSDVPIKINFEDTSFSTELKTKEVQELCERAMGRDLYFKMVKQRNIESVIGKAYTELEDEEVISEEPVEQDWILRFFICAEEISDEDMQTLWARILAGEIKKPKSYSLRTLETLRNLSKEEALLFQRLGDYVIKIKNSSDYFVIRSNRLLEKYGLNYENLLLLEECGLLMTGLGIVVTGVLTKDNNILTENNNIQVRALINTSLKEEWNLEGYPLTKSGQELLEIMGNDTKDEVLMDLITIMKKEFPVILLETKNKPNSKE